MHFLRKVFSGNKKVNGVKHITIKCIELSLGLPMHFKMNLEIYQTQKVMSLIVIS